MEPTFVLAIVRDVEADTTVRFTDTFVKEMRKYVGTTMKMFPIPTFLGWYYGEKGYYFHESWLIFTYENSKSTENSFFD